MKTSHPICQHFVECLCSAVLMVQLRETRVVDSAVVVWGIFCIRENCAAHFDSLR